MFSPRTTLTILPAAGITASAAGVVLAKAIAKVGDDSAVRYTAEAVGYTDALCDDGQLDLSKRREQAPWR